MTQLRHSWVASANAAGNQFPLNNLPYGVFSTNNEPPRCGVAIGDMILDVHELEREGVLSFSGTLQTGSWNAFMALGQESWRKLRAALTMLLEKRSDGEKILKPHLISQADVQLFMPFTVSEYTDFYSSRDHAFNVGTMFRGPENALPPNWLHIPIGYNGRASSVVVSGTPIIRPWGQLKGPTEDAPRFAPSQRFDIELEMGAIVGQPSQGPISVAEADENIFGYVLLNDWSARDIQAWEYQPLGPFQSKATATSISPWIVTALALEPFRVSTPEREVPLLPHLQEQKPALYDIELQVALQPENGEVSTIAKTNYKVMYYSAAQQLAHHTTSGCPMRVGDLLGSGTISGSEKENRGSLLELSWGGKEPFTLPDGSERTFIQDGDSLTLSGSAKGDGFTIGFGFCTGQVRAASKNPYGN